MQFLFDFKKIKKIDPVLAFLVILISIIGLANIYSTTYYDNPGSNAALQNALSFYSIGFSVLFLGVIFKYKILKNRWFLFFLFLATTLLLALVLLIGIDVGETRRWISLGGINIQPSEIAKLALVILFAGIYSLKKSFFTRLMLLGLVFSAFVALIFLQKSLGNTLLLTGIFAGLIYVITPLNKKTIWGIGIFLFGNALSFLVSGPEYQILAYVLVSLLVLPLLFAIRRKFRKKIQVAGLITYYALLLIFVLALSIKPAFDYSYQNILRPYQRERVENFLGRSDSNDLAENYQINQSLRAIGSAGLFGKGYLQSEYSNLNLLPLSESDFAFAALSEQIGFIGTFIVVGIYSAILLRIIYIAKHTKDRFGAIICYGVTLALLLNIVQHIGMNIGLLPITGVPLPFISTGGSALITFFAGIGLVLSIKSSSSFSTVKVVKYV